MAYLYLIRHPRTHVDPSRQAHEWAISDQGRAQVHALTEAPFWKNVVAIYSSNQAKAIEPARTIGQHYGIPVTSMPGLAEVQRGTEIYHSTGDYNTILSKFFSSPDFSVQGWEQAASALTRFQQAISEILANHPAQSVAIVSHGTILTLYTAMLQGQSPTLQRWKGIDFASVGAVDIASMQLVADLSAAPYAAIPVT
jgi:broad specificity phosphatase PhoE